VEALLQRAQAGDAAARGQVLGWLREQIRPWARRRLAGARNGHLDASDVVQEVCCRIHRNFDRLRADCTVPLLLGLARRILDNFAIDQHRARPRVDGAALLDGLVGDGSSPEQRLLRAEQESRLREALTRLPERQGLAFRLRAVEGLTFREIGERLGLSLGQARVLFLRATEALQAVLAESL
jgi:RNA polymerase sigma-70 factor (ECF subfamily)